MSEKNRIKIKNTQEQEEILNRAANNNKEAMDALSLALGPVVEHVLNESGMGHATFDNLSVDSINVPIIINFKINKTKQYENPYVIQKDFETIKDDRGEIIKVAQNVDVLRITSKKGTKRAAHWHKHSSHLCLLVSGKMSYYERKVGLDARPIKVEINPNDYFFTGPQIEHLMVFEEDSVFDCYSFGSRNKQDYENDLVRINYDLQEIYDNWKE